MSDQVLDAETVDTSQAGMATGNDGTISDVAIDPIDENEAERTVAQETPSIVPEQNVPARPDDIPEKFWDADAGTLRTETLLKSYRELERKLGTMVPMPNGDDPASRDKLQRALGKPNSADDYQISPPHELITSDPTINAKLHEAGLSSEQAQLVYDLAAEHLVPMIEGVNREASGQIERSQLAAHFGGEEKWQSLAPQIKTWAEANLNDEVYDSLGSSAEGVMAIYHMMQAREPHVISETALPASGVDQGKLSQMMRDPRYWRDRDPNFVAEVTAGYQRLFT